MKKKISAIICMVLALTMFTSMPVYAGSVKNADRNVSYADPATGKTVDGGTNIAFGTAIAESVVEKKVLIEEENGKTYVTIGMGFMEYAGNGQKVDVKIQVNKGDDYSKYRTVSATKVGSCDNGNCHHLKFEVTSADNVICVGYNVAQMNRNVQFFITPQLSTAKDGNGEFGHRTDGDSMRKAFDSKIANKDGASASSGSINKLGGGANADVPGQVKKVESTTEAIIESTTQAITETTEAVTEAAAVEEEVKESNNNVWIIVGVVAAVVVIGVIVGVVVKKKKSQAQ